MNQRSPSVDSAVKTLAVIGAAVAVLAALQVRPQTVASTPVAVPTTSDGGTTGTTGDTPNQPVVGTGTTGVVGSGTSTGSVSSSASCSGGGATDVGVSKSTVKLGATIVQSGIGAAFLGPVRYAMIAVKDRVNRGGGVCGRQLELTLKDDGWEADRGCEYIKNLVEDTKVFALAVNPSSEGLRTCDQYIEAKGVPVIGSDGMLIHQYTNPMIWPVATSTISQMHIIARNVCDRYAADHGGSCKSMNAGIVYDSKYHFGVEGAYAFNAAIRRLTGKDMDGYVDPLKSPTCRERFCGIQAGQPSYTSQVKEFNDHCGPGHVCDFVAFLLEPPTALVWMRDGGIPPGQFPYGIGGAQPLFNRDFAEQCREKCDGMWVWTGYHPPIEQFASLPGVVRYRQEIERVSSSVDTANAFVEGGWIGMNLVVESLKSVGADLTRKRVVAALNSLSLDLGVSSPLAWRANARFANASGQAFAIRYKQNFSGWSYMQTGLIRDPWVGQDIPESER